MAQHSSLRTLVYSVCVLQLLTSAERQVFDLLGYMWLPILGNFLNIIFVIFCIFGVNQRKPNYVSSYSIWSLVWIAWNAFVTCYYMEVGSLDRREDVLSLGTNSFSWWLANGYGCRPVYYHNISNELIIDAMERNVYHPLRLAYATTLMKVQGDTLKHMTLWMDTPGVEAAGYVALSRVQHDKDWSYVGYLKQKHFVPAQL